MRTSVLLVLSSGTLNPVFGSATTGYTASVSNSTVSTSLTATAAEGNAIIRVHRLTGCYANVASGITSGPLALNVGSNTINVLVTAEDGTTTKTYTVAVTATRTFEPTVGSSYQCERCAQFRHPGRQRDQRWWIDDHRAGVVYSSPPPTTIAVIGGTGVVKVVGTGTTGVFTVPVTGLTASTTYSFKAYATNSATGYSAVATFVTLSSNANLGALALSTGTLSPVFQHHHQLYRNGRSPTITVTPTASHAECHHPGAGQRRSV